MNDWMDAAFDALQEPIADGEVVERLVSEGCTLALADKLVTLLPLACGRALLKGTGVSFSRSFRTMGVDGTIGDPHALRSEPHWRKVRSFVAARTASTPDAVAIVGRRSAEVDAVNKARMNGSRLSDLVGADPIFYFLQPGLAEKRRPRPWWAFWRRPKTQ